MAGGGSPACGLHHAAGRQPRGTGGPGSGARRRQTGRAGRGTASALPAVHPVPLPALAVGLALPRQSGPGRVLWRQRDPHRLRRAGLLALALPQRQPGAAPHRRARADAVRSARRDLRRGAGPAAVRPGPCRLDRSGQPPALPGVRPHRARSRPRHDPLHLGARPAAWRLRRGADAARVLAPDAARHHHLDADRAPRPRNVATRRPAAARQLRVRGRTVAAHKRYPRGALNLCPAAAI
ncbi:protein of unknown function [Cupriavidus neocaledonicus]|uniref:Uncharacterized protein n=1 Tax=Cupriavidus neocaledonicus TaxID=1040979 RepID=A0A375H611_9BURK|nr:protein of unknown function [Cupriavidus neocaledonicus]